MTRGPKSKLKSNMLRVSRETGASGDELVICDGNRLVSRILPIEGQGTVEEAFGAIPGKPDYFEDMDSPTADERADV